MPERYAIARAELALVGGRQDPTAVIEADVGATPARERRPDAHFERETEGACDEKQDSAHWLIGAI